jgi:cell wall-associated NlpC family hydrolase
MRQAVVALLVALVVAGGLVGGAGSALAQPPTPPPNPGDDQLDQSHQQVTDRAADVGRITAQLADLDDRTDDIAAALESSREDAEEALLTLDDARAAAADAAKKADDARVATTAASTAIDQARDRLDTFVVATYQEGLDTGPFGLLTAATSPDDLVARAEFSDAIARSQLEAQDGLERARVEKANADSSARAALDEAQRKADEADKAKQDADTAYGVAQTAEDAHAAELAQVNAQRVVLQGQLDAAESSDAGLRAARARYNQWQAQLAAQQEAADRAARAQAVARVAAEADGPPVRGSGSIQRVIDRAMSQLGVQYVWGGGGTRGPSTGVPDRFGSALNRIGFDCSGLMLYAFGAAGVNLPRVSRNQYGAGRNVPISALQPGDMVFYRSGGGPIHHVALYIGRNRMIEAPYTGAAVRVTALRTRGLMPMATRML